MLQDDVKNRLKLQQELKVVSELAEKRLEDYEYLKR
jgi:hypothetical protein